MAHPNSLKNLRPFRPGQSGNPKGRADQKGIAKRIRELSLEGDKLVTYLLDVVDGRVKASVRERNESAAILLDRGWGKPITTTANVELGQDSAVREAASEIADDQLLSLADSLKPSAEGA